jgi:glutathione S-transferase
MKLYFSKGACSLAVRIVINEIGLKSEYEAVNLQEKKVSNGDDFFKINPKGAVPALLTDDQHLLTENAVIQQYLADTHKAHQFCRSWVSTSDITCWNGLTLFLPNCIRVLALCLIRTSLQK